MSIQIEINGSWQNVTKKQIFEMAVRGDILPETMIDVNGQKIPASKVHTIVSDEEQHRNIVPLESDSEVTFPMIFDLNTVEGKIKLTIDENKIIIGQSGCVNFVSHNLHSLKSVRTIYFSKIVSIHFSANSLRFTMPYVLEHNQSTANENTIQFQEDSLEVMSCVYKFIEAKIFNKDSRNAAMALQHAIERKKR
ncbi:MAG: hypothetical protein LBF88_08515 [Planctomycetaceae bacterium]|jgi:hypothetical protein|nr:hypothetical protein [Planctomycetaceae bacterium]